jgi:hypothetical protein
MGLLFQPPAALCHHDLDVATVTRVMLGDVVAEPGSSFQDWRPLPRRMRMPPLSPLP